jgi:hypothetical protein
VIVDVTVGVTVDVIVGVGVGDGQIIELLVKQLIHVVSELIVITGYDNGDVVVIILSTHPIKLENST